VNTALGQQGVTAGPVDTVVVACCQLTPTLGDAGANRERVADAVCHAVSLGARIVVLPDWFPAATSSRTEPRPRPVRSPPTGKR
jgi:hypothetical protein